MISDESDVPAFYKWVVDRHGPEKNGEERSIKISTFILEANAYLRALDSAVVLVTVKNVNLGQVCLCFETPRLISGQLGGDI